MVKITDEIRRLFDKVYSILGAPISSVELDDEQMCKLLEVAIEDYSEKIQNEIISNSWAGFYGKNTANPSELAHAFMTRSLDLTKEYSYWFSKQVGLQQSGPWELKRILLQLNKENKYM